MYIFLIGIIICGIILLITFPHSAKKTLEISNKIKTNDFVLVKADIIKIHEDKRSADNESSPNCYITCNYKIDNIKKQIKVEAMAECAETFEKNQNAYFLFTLHNGSITEKPIALYFGNDYKIAQGIKVI